MAHLAAMATQLSATLTVLAAPTITKSFAPSTITVTRHLDDDRDNHQPERGHGDTRASTVS